MSHLIKSGKLYFLEAFFIKRRYPGSVSGGHPGPAHRNLYLYPCRLTLPKKRTKPNYRKLNFGQKSEKNENH